MNLGQRSKSSNGDKNLYYVATDYKKVKSQSVLPRVFAIEFLIE